TLDRYSNPDNPVISSPFYCEGDALDHSTTELAQNVDSVYSENTLATSDLEFTTNVSDLNFIKNLHRQLQSFGSIEEAYSGNEE
ncbi:unnamed protein product, partial [Timema podura]|nr:unnamed protein product [Timema podura]